MIIIDDKDLPITAAEKIINGKRPNDMSESLKMATEKLFGMNCDFQDMFDLEEIKEIADYLLVYYTSHINGD